MHNNWEIRVFRGREGLLEIKNEWLQVCAGIQNPRFFHYYQWYESYLWSLEEDPLSVRFFVIYKDNLPISIIPLRICISTIMGLRMKMLELPSHNHMNLSDIICSEKNTDLPFIEFFLQYLRKMNELYWDTICFHNVLEDSVAYSLLTKSRVRLRLIEQTFRCDYLECLPAETLVKRYSKNFKNNLRKAHNKLLKMRNVEFTCVHSIPMESSFDEFLQVEASGWKGVNGTGSAIILHKNITDFYRKLLYGFSQTGNCEINLLKVDGNCISGQFCLVIGNTSYFLKVAYREDYSMLAPGNLLLDYVLRQYEQSGKIKYLNLINDTSWHASWCPQSYQVSDLYLFNRSIKGLLIYCALRLKQKLRPNYHKVVRIYRNIRIPFVSKKEPQ